VTFWGLLLVIQCPGDFNSFLKKVKAHRGSCLLIPCQFTSERLVGSSPVGVWKVGSKTGKEVSRNNQSLDIWKNLNVYLVGDLKVKNCTTLLYGIQPNHAKKYYFREETIPYNFDELTSLFILCSAPAPCADENPSIRWDDLLNGTVTQNETTRADGNKAMVSILTFRASFLHNKKTLICTAQYTVGSVNKTAKRTTTLNVLYAPKKTSASSQAGGVLEGPAATLTCSSEANPAVVQYTWFRGNEETTIDTGPTLTFRQVTISQAGVYYCQARNTHGAETSPPVTLDVLCRYLRSDRRVAWKTT
uniref:Ig-like domain-containing protein n=1 Tax=Erpetoichthys calabaricus TaxID=27687 RepID=A0A8C4TD44_ERPCA